MISAIKSATEKEDRKRGAIIYGVEESDTDVFSERVSGIFLKFGEAPKPLVRDSYRFGTKKSSNIRPSSQLTCAQTEQLRRDEPIPEALSGIETQK